jgi:hypothetical protein
MLHPLRVPDLRIHIYIYMYSGAQTVRRRSYNETLYRIVHVYYTSILYVERVFRRDMYNDVYTGY